MENLEADLTLIGTRIRKLRIKAGYSQEGFAHHADLNRGYMGRIERGECNITYDILSRICRGLDIKMDTLLEGLPSKQAT